ncbi:hypothetical protein BH11MYX4_BH11MYX4_24050 [soil metagenome]
MSPKIERREAIRRLAVISTAALLPAWLLACSKKESCLDVTGLTPEEVRIRNETAKYVEQTMDATKRCSGCLHYIAAAPEKCGQCKVVKGPINADGNCNLYAAKPA